MKKVSVVIPAYNAEKTLQKCLESVLANSYNNYEVIAVDDCSTDSTKEIIKNINNSKLKLIQNKENKGAAASRNLAIRKAEGEVILLLDSDSYVKKDWIERHVILHEKTEADIIGGGIEGVHKTVWGKADNFCSWWTSIPDTKDHYIKKLHLPTNNLSFKKNILEKIGYLDEGLKTGEDAEFCFRALKKGLKIFFKGDLVISHYDKDSYRDFINHQAAWGKHVIQMRKKKKMNYAWLFPGNYFTAILYIIPLALFYTFFTVTKWICHKPSVIFYKPLIFLGKIKWAVAIKNSLKK